MEENQKTIKYRQIWGEIYGEIPKGHIVHHINGNSKDNRIENLQCCSIQDHMRIHSYRYHMINDEWHKFCIDCKLILPLNAYYIWQTPKKYMKVKVVCKKCESIRNSKKYYNKKFK